MERVIEFYAGGKTSIHRHLVAETITVIRGGLTVFMGDDATCLAEVALAPGNAINIPSNVWHSAMCRVVASEREPFAMALEEVSGSNLGGSYPIERFAPAVASPTLAEVLARDVERVGHLRAAETIQGLLLHTDGVSTDTKLCDARAITHGHHCCGAN
jgi:hypothetical protein